MIRSLRAMIWLRWRLLLGAIRGGRKRDALEQVSRAFALVIPIAFGALSIGTVVAVCICGYLGARAITTGLFEADVIVFIVRIALVVMLCLVVIITMASPVQSTLTRYHRLLLLPIPRQTLHLVEVGANVADPLLGFMVPGMIVFAVGLALGGYFGGALVAMAAAVVMTAVLATMASLLSFLVAWLFRSRRRGEVFTLVLVLAMSFLSLLPAMLSKTLDDTKAGRRDRPDAQSVAELDARLPVWSRALPSELFGRTVLAGIEGRHRTAAVAMSALAMQAGLLYFASSLVHRRLIESLEGDVQRRRGAGVRRTARKLPFVGVPVSAVALTQFRTAFRSVRGRLAILLPGPLLALLTLLGRGMPEEFQWAITLASQGHLLLAVGVIFSIYAMQAFTMNFFASDRRGLALHFVSPIDDGDLALGKVLGGGLILALAVGVCAVTALIVSPTGSPFYWLAILAGGVATFMLLSPIAIVLSAIFPVASDLSKTGGGGNPHPFPMFGGTLITLAVAAPAGLIMAADALWIHRPDAAFLWMLVWMLMATAIAIPLVGLAARSIGTRRENLALVAHGR